MRRARSQFGADLDEYGRQDVGCLEQQIADIVGIVGLAAGDPPSL
jgi:hypothetical protein